MPLSAHGRRTLSREESRNFFFMHEPLFQDQYVSPVEEQLPFELSAASAARFHDYLQDLSSTDPSAENSEYEDDDDEEVVSIHEGHAKTVYINSPGKPKMIELPPLSSVGSSRSANSSSSDVRTSGFLHSRSPSDASTCDTPYTPDTPVSFFDSSEDTTPSEEFDDKIGVVQYDVELSKTVTQSSRSTAPGVWEDVDD